MDFTASTARHLRFWHQRGQDVVESWKEMARPQTLAADVAAGLSVACVALPLNIALATAAGLPAGAGLVSGIVGGGVAALLGSRFQVTGPEAAVLPASALIVAAHGPVGLVIATLIVGLLQMALGLARVGAWARLIPRTVVKGFTVGIGLVLLNSQLPRLFAVEATHADALSLVQRTDWWSQVSWVGVAAGAIAAAGMLLLPKVSKRVPAVLVGLLLATAFMLMWGLNYDSVGALPTMLPAPALPSLHGVDWASLLPAALGLAFVSSLGSLLATSSLDGLKPVSGSTSDLDQELVAQGLANLTAGLVGGFPVMGAIVRSSTSVQSGARTRAASLFHAAWLLVALMLLAPWVAHIPVAVLTAILLVVGGRLIDLKGLLAMWKQSKAAVCVVLVTAGLIATVHFTAGIAVGLVLALVLALRRHGALRLEVERDVASNELTVARVGGPLLFINHSKLYTLLEGNRWPKLVAMDLSACPMVDSAGAATLQYLAEFLAIRQSHLALCNVPSHLRDSLENVVSHLLQARFHDSLAHAQLAAGLLPVQSRPGLAFRTGGTLNPDGRRNPSDSPPRPRAA